MPPEDAIVFSDSSERFENDTRGVGYGYVVFRTQQQIAGGSAPMNPLTHVFDAEVVGTLHRLQSTLEYVLGAPQYWLCINSTSVIWCTCGDPSLSSNWAF